MRRLPLRSPPRMRGKGLCKGFHLCDVGITPACAGKSEKQVPFLPPYQDHPRVCGEKGGVPGRDHELVGSPPRVRGKEVRGEPAEYRSGITPAYAGKRGRAGLPQRQLRDHPRVCGEKAGKTVEEINEQGSPPRVRGKVKDSLLDCPQSRITPACAGKRWANQHRWSGCRDHPRVCGEKSIVRPSSGPVTGSPPRVRGKAEPFQA